MQLELGREHTGSGQSIAGAQGAAGLGIRFQALDDSGRVALGCAAVASSVLVVVAFVMLFGDEGVEEAGEEGGGK